MTLQKTLSSYKTKNDFQKLGEKRNKNMTKPNKRQETRKRTTKNIFLRTFNSHSYGKASKETLIKIRCYEVSSDLKMFKPLKKKL